MHHEQVLLGQDHAILWPVAGYCLLLNIQENNFMYCHDYNVVLLLTMCTLFKDAFYSECMYYSRKCGIGHLYTNLNTDKRFTIYNYDVMQAQLRGRGAPSFQ